jgi:hypothetical protein
VAPSCSARIAFSPPIVPETKMNGVSGASSRARPSAQPVEARHREIREDDVWREFDQLAPERRLGVDAHAVAGHAAAPQLVQRQLGVSLGVLGQQKFQLSRHAATLYPLCAACL